MAVAAAGAPSCPGLVNGERSSSTAGALRRGLCDGHHSQCSQRGATAKHTPPADGSILSRLMTGALSAQQHPASEDAATKVSETLNGVIGVIRDSWRIVGTSRLLRAGGTLLGAATWRRLR